MDASLLSVQAMTATSSGKVPEGSRTTFRSFGGARDTARAIANGDNGPLAAIDDFRAILKLGVCRATSDRVWQHKAIPEGN